MRKLLIFGLLFCLGAAPLHTLAASEQTTTIHATVNAEKAGELEELINKEKGRKQGEYSPESWKKYEAALKNAEEILKNTPYDEEKVNAALAELQQAITGLKEKPSGGRTSTVLAARNSPAAKKNSAPKKYPPTGMITGQGLSMLGLLLMAGAGITWQLINRRNKD